MSKTMTWQMYDPNFPSPIPVAMEALYQWDNQGKQASLTYPQANWNGQGSPTSSLEYTYQYDAMGRLNVAAGTALPTTLRE